jgi:hypothetical protein
MLKYNFVYNNDINNIIFPLKSDFDFLPNKDFITEENLADDDFIDFEISKYNLSANVNFDFIFFNTIYQNSFITAGFTEEEINLSNKNYRYSYILIQVYDSFDSKNQNLLHTGYIPIYLFPDKVTSSFNINIFNKYFEFNNIYIFNSYELINGQTLYFKFNFFNAKIGRLILFYNQSILNNTEEKMYFKGSINTDNQSYSFNTSNIVCHQFLNEEFINKINERNKTENKSPLYTDGELFNIDGDYV